MAQCKTAVSPLLPHWRYCSLALGHWNNVYSPPVGDRLIHKGVFLESSAVFEVPVSNQARYVLYVLYVEFTALMQMYLLPHWRYCSLTLGHRNNVYSPPVGDRLIHKGVFLESSAVFEVPVSNQARYVLYVLYVEFTALMQMYLLPHWRYCSLTLGHRNNVYSPPVGDRLIHKGVFLESSAVFEVSVSNQARYVLYVLYVEFTALMQMYLYYMIH